MKTSLAAGVESSGITRVSCYLGAIGHTQGRQSGSRHETRHEHNDLSGFGSCLNESGSNRVGHD